jgi:hypothetical protein
MNTKLTLTIEHSLIKKAKQYAKDQGKSLSSIIENFLKAVTNEEKVKTIDSTPITSSLRGSFKAPDDFDYKTELTKRLTEKYLGNE